MEQQFAPFEEKINYTFKNKQLLTQAFLHRSYLNEHRELGIENNERLEFLGDAVLELVVTEHLYRKFPKRPEGELTAFRSALVNTSTLSSVARSLGMDDYLLLSRGEAQDTGRARQYILANTLEAFVGAIYLDQGYEPAAAFILRTILPLTDEMVKNRLWQDHKSLFQEKAQEIEGITPSYKTLEEVGPDHDKHFTVGVYLENECIAEGVGKSKQEAEQDAARLGLLARKWE